MSSDASPLRVRATRVDEPERIRAIRLASLAADPGAFGSTLASELRRPASFWSDWAERSAAGVDQRTFVLVDAVDTWLGMLLVRVNGDEPGTGFVNGMWIDPAARRRGGTQALCDAAAAWATDRGLTALTLDVVNSNDGARLAYEAAGFVVTGPNVWRSEGRTLHEHRMRRNL